MERLAIHETACSVTDCQCSTKFSICHLDATVSKPASKYHSIIMCKLIWRFKRKSCHTSPLKNKFSAAIIRRQNLLNTDRVILNICR